MKEINFILPTDWMFTEPIDAEHKKYVLLSYLQKIDVLITENKLYPHFIELSLHMANVHTLIKENTILYTDKVFKTPDDELLLKELLVKPTPTLTENENEEIKEILKFSSTKFFDYFQIVKSYWSMFYETISISVKKNKNKIESNNGVFYYFTKTDVMYVWEYDINLENPEQVTTVNLLYSGEENKINKILKSYTNYDEDRIKKIPIFEFRTDEEYPINETLLPLFKRKLLSYIFQKNSINSLKKIEN